ncbi:MAG: ABC transporter permease [Verrucomicrobiota bacterium]
MSALWTGFVNGSREIWAHKVRTMLSISGIVLGVAALVSMVGVIDGMIGSTRKAFDSLGGIEKIEIGSKSVPDRQEEIAYLSPGMTIYDIDALRSSVDGISHASTRFDEGWERISYESRAYSAPVFGVEPDFQVILNYEMLSGRFISEMDIKRKERVIVLGPPLSNRIFPGESPIGKHVRLNGASYRVIGVLEEEFLGQPGQKRNALRGKFRIAFIPVSTAMEHRGEENDINRIFLKVENPSELVEVTGSVENAMRIAHNGILDFEVETGEDQLAELSKLERNFKFSLGGIAGISLIVGGIGIMNVMLASVNERIREIGVRKAIGAQGMDVFIQFIAESIVISILGCLLGMLISLALIQVFRTTIPGGDVIESIPWNAMMLALIFSSAIGVLSGVYPAVRAALLNPIEALRHE